MEALNITMSVPVIALIVGFVACVLYLKSPLCDPAFGSTTEDFVFNPETYVPGQWRKPERKPRQIAKKTTPVQATPLNTDLIINVISRRLGWYGIQMDEIADEIMSYASPLESKTTRTMVSSRAVKGSEWRYYDDFDWYAAHRPSGANTGPK